MKWVLALIAIASALNEIGIASAARRIANEVPDQTIEPASHSSSRTGIAVGAGVGILILGGATFYGWRRGHPSEHPYP